LEAELGKDVLDMVLRGAFRDVQQAGDLPVGEAARDQLGDLALAPGKAAWPAAVGIAAQAVGQSLRVGAQDLHAEPGRAACGVVCQDERFRTVFSPAARCEAGPRHVKFPGPAHEGPQPPPGRLLAGHSLILRRPEVGCGSEYQI
jgi:hypothetical protein